MNHTLKITKPQNRTGKLLSVVKHIYFRLKRRHKTGDYPEQARRFVRTEVLKQPKNRLNKRRKAVHEDFGKDAVSEMIFRRRLEQPAG